MIVCFYGDECAPFVEEVAHDLVIAGRALGAEIQPVTLSAAVCEPWRWRGAERAYVLPFAIPRALPDHLPRVGSELVHALFPHAEVINPCHVHDACWDKLTTARRLLARGVPMPDTLITQEPEEVRDFVGMHGHVVLKEPLSCAGEGHVVVSLGDEHELVGETRGRRYLLRLAPEATARRLDDGILSWPAPFYLQRLIAAVGRKGVLAPAQVLRAYVVDGRITFWTERYRERFRRPSDFIINVALGAKYRFLSTVSDETGKIAARAAEVMGVRIGAIDLVRAGSEGPYVLEVDTDGEHMIIDRQFKHLPEFRSVFDFDYSIAEVLVAPVAPTRVRTHGRLG